MEVLNLLTNLLDGQLHLDGQLREDEAWRFAAKGVGLSMELLGEKVEPLPNGLTTIFRKDARHLADMGGDSIELLRDVKANRCRMGLLSNAILNQGLTGGRGQIGKGLSKPLPRFVANLLEDRRHQGASSGSEVLDVGQAPLDGRRELCTLSGSGSLEGLKGSSGQRQHGRLECDRIHALIAKHAWPSQEVCHAPRRHQLARLLPDSLGEVEDLGEPVRLKTRAISTGLQSRERNSQLNLSPRKARRDEVSHGLFESLALVWQAGRKLRETTVDRANLNAGHARWRGSVGHSEACHAVNGHSFGIVRG